MSINRKYHYASDSLDFHKNTPRHLNHAQFCPKTIFIFRSFSRCCRLWHHTGCTINAWIVNDCKTKTIHKSIDYAAAHASAKFTHAIHWSHCDPQTRSILIEEHSLFFALFFMRFWRFRHGFSRIHLVHTSYLFCLMYNYLRIKL